MLKALKTLLFGKPAHKEITEWFQISYQEGGCTSIVIKEDFDSALSWCREQLYIKDSITMYHINTKNHTHELLLTIKWKECITDERTY